MSLGGLGLRRRLAVALGVLEDVQTLAQAAERSGRSSFEQQQVLVQAGERAPGGQRVNGLDQVLLLALCLGHHLLGDKTHADRNEKEVTDWELNSLCCRKNLPSLHLLL